MEKEALPECRGAAGLVLVPLVLRSTQEFLEGAWDKEAPNNRREEELQGTPPKDPIKRSWDRGASV